MTQQPDPHPPDPDDSRPELSDDELLAAAWADVDRLEQQTDWAVVLWGEGTC